MQKVPPELPWRLEELERTPHVYPVPEMDEGAVKAIYYDGLPYRGKPTRVFAYFALPELPLEERVPAVVLVHGGGGTAFREWVSLWTERGYAAIAMDLEGHVPTRKTEAGVWPGHAWSGPPRQGIFEDYAQPVQEQWMYHAVAGRRARAFAASLAGRHRSGAHRRRRHFVGWDRDRRSLGSRREIRFRGVQEVYRFRLPGEERMGMMPFVLFCYNANDAGTLMTMG